MAEARGSDERALTISVVMVSTVVMPMDTRQGSWKPQPGCHTHPYPPPLPETPSSDVPRDTRAGTAAWLIQKETQDMATSRTDGM